MTDRFDEETLLSAVVAQWGEYGAHADVFRMMQAEIERLRSALTTASAVSHGCSTGFFPCWCEEARRG